MLPSSLTMKAVAGVVPKVTALAPKSAVPKMVTGVPPYSRGDHMSVMYQHVQGKAKVAGEVNPSLPPGLSDLVMRAMAVDKTKRFQTMAELSAALERFR